MCILSGVNILIRFNKLFSVALSLFFLAGCVGTSMRYYPTEQPKTTWTTDDNRACFYVGENEEPISGYIKSESVAINVRYAMKPQVTRIMVYDENENCIEEWNVKTVKKEKLVVCVDNSTYFTKGETLIFYRENENSEK